MGDSGRLEQPGNKYYINKLILITLILWIQSYPLSHSTEYVYNEPEVQLHNSFAQFFLGCKWFWFSKKVDLVPVQASVAKIICLLPPLLF